MGVRKGQGYNVPKPKRVHCLECGEKGVKQWYVNSHGIWRDCQYCCHTWGEISWSIAMKAREQGRALASESRPIAPYGWHCELVHKESGEVIQDIFTRVGPLEGPDTVKGFVWRSTAVDAIPQSKRGAS